MTHRHGWPYNDHEPGCTDVSPTVCLRPTVHGGNPDITTADGAIAGGPDEHLEGFIVAYEWADSDVRLEGHVRVDPDIPEGPCWQMTGTLEGGDLTLTPSIQAYDARDPDDRKPTIHGFVTSGKWVPA
jgi:hypothetical protein